MTRARFWTPEKLIELRRCSESGMELTAIEQRFPGHSRRAIATQIRNVRGVVPTSGELLKDEIRLHMANHTDVVASDVARFFSISVERAKSALRSMHRAGSIRVVGYRRASPVFALGNGADVSREDWLLLEGASYSASTFPAKSSGDLALRRGVVWSSAKAGEYTKRSDELMAAFYGDLA
ncbi:hypothetical protein [Pandoraea sputorum]|nr:hypothetical protein [Pandoraea sputorum]